MARNGTKSGGKDFELGNEIGQLGGRPPLPKDIKEARELNQVEAVRLLNKFRNMSLDELKEISSNPSTTAFDHMLISVIKYGISQKNPMAALEFFFNRLIGKPKESLEITVNPYQQKSLSELEELLEARRRLPPPT